MSGYGQKPPVEVAHPILITKVVRLPLNGRFLVSKLPVPPPQPGHLQPLTQVVVGIFGHRGAPRQRTFVCRFVRGRRGD